MALCGRSPSALALAAAGARLAAQQLDATCGAHMWAPGARSLAHTCSAAADTVCTWPPRPPGSLLLCEPTTSGSALAAAATRLAGRRSATLAPAAAAAAACQLQHVRGAKRGAMFAGIDPWSFFDYRKLIYPDVYDANEALLVNRFKTHGSLAERYEAPAAAAAAASSGPAGSGAAGAAAGSAAGWGLGGLPNPLADPELERRVKYFNKRLHTSFVCYRSLWGYSGAALQARVLDAYVAVNKAIASRNLAAVEPFVTEQMLQRLSGEVARRGGMAARAEWRLAGEPAASSAVTLLHGAVVPNPLKQGRLHFVQWTAQIRTRQVVAVYDSRGRLLAGDPDKELEVVDTWVFERPILKALFVPRPGPQGATWRLLERL